MPHYRGSTYKWVVKSLVLLMVLACVVAALTGCGRGGQREAPPEEAEEAVEVVMKDNAFQPIEIEVEVGTTVTWTNQDDVTHTVTSSEEGLFDSGDLSGGDTFQHTFEEPGTYDY